MMNEPSGFDDVPPKQSKLKAPVLKIPLYGKSFNIPSQLSWYDFLLHSFYGKFNLQLRAELISRPFKFSRKLFRILGE